MQTNGHSGNRRGVAPGKDQDAIFFDSDAGIDSAEEARASNGS